MDYYFGPSFYDYLWRLVALSEPEPEGAVARRVW